MLSVGTLTHRYALTFKKLIDIAAAHGILVYPCTLLLISKLDTWEAFNTLRIAFFLILKLEKYE